MSKDPLHKLKMKQDNLGNNVITLDAETEVTITDIYDNKPDIFQLYTDDGACFEVLRNSKFGKFINKSLRKQKLIKLNGKI